MTELGSTWKPHWKVKSGFPHDNNPPLLDIPPLAGKSWIWQIWQSLYLYSKLPEIKLRDSASSFHWLSSSIFSYWLFVRPALVTSPLISTTWCFRAYKPYIFCEDMILATCQCQHIFCCWVEPSLLLSSLNNEQLHCDLWIQSDGDSIRNSCDVLYVMRN